MMMKLFLGKADEILRFLLGGPTSQQQQLILLGLGLLTGLFLFSRMAGLTGMKRTGVGLVLGVFVLGVVFVLAGMVLADEFVIGQVLKIERVAGLGLAALVMSLLVVAPLVSVVQKGTYLSSVIAWVSAVMAALFVMVIARVGIEMADSGGESAVKVKARNAEVESLIDGKK